MTSEQKTKLSSNKWRDIVGYEGLYKISKYGEIYSMYKNLILVGSKSHNGYHQSCLYKNKVAKTVRIHCEVLKAFIGPRPTKLHDAAHLDSDINNNRLSNLKWCTKKQNQRHAILNGTFVLGERNGRAKLTSKDVLEIRRLHSEGVTYSELSRKYKIYYNHAYLICKRLSWKHL